MARDSRSFKGNSGDARTSLPAISVYATLEGKIKGNNVKTACGLIILTTKNSYNIIIIL